MDVLQQQSSLNVLIEKLIHSIAEVRYRSLENLLFKLSNNLITINDLCQNKNFLLNCMKFFYNENNKSKYNLGLKLINEICINKPSAMDYFAKNKFGSYLHELKSLNQWTENELNMFNNVIKLIVSSPKYNKHKNNNEIDDQKQEKSPLIVSNINNNHQNQLNFYTH